MVFTFPLPVDYVAVAAATVVSFVIGAIWYAPPVFGKEWMRLIGRDKLPPADMKKAMPKALVGVLITDFILCFVIAHLILYAEATTILQGIAVGLFGWLGFMFSILLNEVTFEGRPAKLFLINGAYNLAMCAVAGALLVW